ncbi:MAG: DNA-protecting protein DprA, partial [Bacteroidales bacterium]|nr:DNA-protecting protein DprA [Bacteroidales bacterium]
ANSYNRDVFAVPGRLNNTYSEGCNHLVKTNKAALIQSADDIKYIMGWESVSSKHTPKQHKLFVNLSSEEEILLTLFKNNKEIGIDQLCIQSKLNISKVASALLNLEFEGIINSLPGKMYRLI